MGRTRNLIKGLHLDMGGRTEPITESKIDPKVGYIYRSMGGPVNYWWIIGISTTTYGGEFAHYLVFNPQGGLTGTGRIGTHALKLRPLVGHCDFPTFKPEWY